MSMRSEPNAGDAVDKTARRPGYHGASDAMPAPMARSWRGRGTSVYRSMAIPNAKRDALDTFYATLEEALVVNGSAVCRYDETDVEHLVEIDRTGLRVITRNATGTLDEAFYPALASAVLDMAGASVVRPARCQTGDRHL